MGVLFSEKHKTHLSNTLKGKFGEDARNWQGGFDKKRPWVLPKSQCIKLNKRFVGSEGHHLTSSVMVYIPKYIHRSVWHNMKNGLRMEEINKVAYNYLRGEF